MNAAGIVLKVDLPKPPFVARLLLRVPLDLATRAQPWIIAGFGLASAAQLVAALNGPIPRALATLVWGVFALLMGAGLSVQQTHMWWRGVMLRGELDAIRRASHEQFQAYLTEAFTAAVEGREPPAPPVRH